MKTKDEIRKEMEYLSRPKFLEFLSDPGRICGIVSSFKYGTSSGMMYEHRENFTRDIYDFKEDFAEIHGSFNDSGDGSGKDVTIQIGAYLVSEDVHADDPAGNAKADLFKEGLLKIAAKYGQHIVLYKDGTAFYEICAKDKNGKKIGDVLVTYPIENHDVPTMAKMLMEKYFKGFLHGRYDNMKTSLITDEHDSERDRDGFVLKEHHTLKYSPLWIAVSMGAKIGWVNI